MPGTVSFRGEQLNIFPKVFKNDEDDYDTEDLQVDDLINNLVIWLGYCDRLNFPLVTMRGELSGAENLLELFITMAAIKKLNSAGIRCTLLTKGILPIELFLQSPDNEYGITLVSLNEDYRVRTEPGASPYAERIAALKALHERGCKTWVSIEPYPTPNIITQDLMEILGAVSFANRIIFGRTNYSKEVTAFTKHRSFYNDQAEIVVRFCRERNINFHITNGTIT